jgi:hypothetical protein
MSLEERIASATEAASDRIVETLSDLIGGIQSVTLGDECSVPMVFDLPNTSPEVVRYSSDVPDPNKLAGTRRGRPSPRAPRRTSPAGCGN